MPAGDNAFLSVQHHWYYGILTFHKPFVLPLFQHIELISQGFRRKKTVKNAGMSYAKRIYDWAIHS